MQGHEKGNFIRHVQSRGLPLYYDKRMLTSLISDLFSTNIKLCNSLKIVVEIGFSVQIANMASLDKSRQKLGIKQIICSIVDEYGIEESRAVEAVHTLAFCIGITDTLDDLFALEIGALINFGKYIWTVINIRSDKALLLCNSTIAKSQYHSASGDVTWAECSLRRYLNTIFYECFTSEEQARIVETTLHNTDNPWFGTNGGNDTSDFIFLLSIEEIVTYFGDSGQLRNRNPSNENWIADEFNAERALIGDDGSAVWWWLRSPGLNSIHTASILGGGDMFGGVISVRGDISTNNNGTVRPALWISVF